ncbi:MAG: exodeoxyribonuclease VII small subunit [Clostridia bacterium]|nr:exodeoxyribonuclease VII small subunit [Clostridia bacterium]
MEKKKMSFEEALARLDEIVGSMENGKAELDELLSLFEEGVSLVKLCNSKLNSAERKIKLVKANGDEVPFENTAEEI